MLHRQLTQFHDFTNLSYKSFKKALKTSDNNIHDFNFSFAFLRGSKSFIRNTGSSIFLQTVQFIISSRKNWNNLTFTF